MRNRARCYIKGRRVTAWEKRKTGQPWQSALWGVPLREVVPVTNGQRAEVIRLRQEGIGYAAIASKLGISANTVKSFCRRNGLAGCVEEKKPTMEEGYCRECGRKLVQPEKMKKISFCSKECRQKWWKEHPEQLQKKALYSFTCACCGKEFTAYGNKGRKYCSHECYIRDRFGGGKQDGETGI